ncbi:MAG: CidA/LrgA family protein [Lachnospiraceae bacterium]|jgi:holin-like protein|nr:CidA/LrgA family protein [Lachnospiraceae bacterium]
MKYLQECGIILGITLVGEWLKNILPLPVPAGVYGLFLLLFLLCKGILKLEQIETTGNFFLEIMSVMFVPAAVGLMDSYELILPVLIPLISICGISTIIVMAVTGKAADWMIHRRETSIKKKNGGLKS